VVGLSLVEAMRAQCCPTPRPGFHAALAEDYKRAFQRDARHEGLTEEPLYDGVPELIDALDEGGWMLGVATGKSDRGLRLCLERHSLHPRFVTLQTADRHPSKPHPSMIEAAMAEAGAAPETTLMIGDTVFDIEMARAAGTTAIGVAWGYHEAEELKGAGAHFVATRPGEVSDFVRAFA
jgi:phosphoglycolate phosphatase